jgi:chromosome segregation protein
VKRRAARQEEGQHLLKLKRVEIQGFKSFCERTEMRFHGEGIAAIVGPNGCGKSNLSDAISWVLGEQSAKSLRGTQMMDVIFAGTRERKPLGMAQVTMTLVDPGAEADPAAATAPAGPRKPSDVTITRRLYRSGESEYLVDGKSARLRDIQDIFMGTGLGPESYAIIEQGRIGQLLSSKPQDRRSVIEEAAGISKFKNRRRLAEAKLESAKHNLSRVFDILEEVGRQANSLKRQAAKAKRYGELRVELVDALRTSLTGRFRLLERDATRIALELSQANNEFQALGAQVAEQEEAYRRQQEQAYATEAALAEARKRQSELQIEAERIGSRRESQAAQAASLESRAAQGTAEIERIAAQAEAVRNELEASAQAVARLEAEAAESTQLLAVKNAEREQAAEALRGHQRGVEQAQQAVMKLLGEASQIKNRLAQMETHSAALERDKSRLQRDDQMASADLERLDQRKKEIEEQLSRQQLELESAADQRKRIEGDLAERRTTLASTRKELEELRNEASRIKARKDSLEEILSHRAYTTESVKGLFTAVEQGQAQMLHPLGVLADFVEVDPTYEKAAEEFLHDELEYVLVKDWTQAESGIDLMRTDLDGRVTFLVHPEPGAGDSDEHVRWPAIGPETGIAAKLSDVLRMTNGLTGAPAALLPRLSRCFVARDRQAAQRLAPQYPDLYFLTSDGICYQGQAVSGGRKTGSGPLALKRELRELTALSAQRKTAVEETTAIVESIERDLGLMTEELERLRTVQQRHEREALALDHELRKLSEDFARSNSRVSVARLELDRIAKEEERVAGERASQTEALAQREGARADEESKLAAARESMSSLQAHWNQLGEQTAALRAELAGREERARAERAAQNRALQQLQQLNGRNENLSREIERLNTDRQRLIQEDGELAARAAEVAGQRELAEAEVTRLASNEASERESLAALDAALRQGRNDTQAAQEKRSQIEVALVERRAEIRYLDESARKDLNVPVEELAAGIDTIPDEVALAETDEKVASLRTRIENLGAVNPEALEEYEEAQRRYDFLNTQRQDLLDSIRDTEKAIQEIDVESRRRFTEAFGVINNNFKETFTKLFGGGSAEMRLTDESNVNDSGIDIIASPPGKRLQNVLLLSGGEKALTAISLLMAIFRYAPSPFCILDEVDAPLDEPNIQRLTGLLKEMSDRTQFIVITHAKRTMETAQALYGVTMQEPGVSRLVAVRFNEAGGASPGAKPQLALAG